MVSFNPTLKRSHSADALDTAKQARTTPSSLTDTPPEVLGEMMSYLRANDRRPFAEGVCTNLQGQWFRPPPPELAAADGVLAMRGAPDLPQALQALRDRWDTIDPAFRHQPLVELINRWTRDFEQLNLPAHREFRAAVQQLCSTLPAHRRAQVDWLMTAIASDGRQLTTLDQAHTHVQRLGDMPESSMLAMAQRRAMTRALGLARNELAAGGDTAETIDRVERILTDCLRPGSPPTDPGEAVESLRAPVLRRALTGIHEWHNHNLPPLHQASAALLDGVAGLPAAHRHRARLNDPEEHGAALVSLLQMAGPQRVMPLFERLLNMQYRDAGEHLQHMAALVPHLPADSMAQQLEEIAQRATALRLDDMPENVLLNLAGADILNAMPAEQRAQALRTLVLSARTLESRNAIDPASRDEILDAVQELLPLVPAGARPELQQLLSSLRQP